MNGFIKQIVFGMICAICEIAVFYTVTRCHGKNHYLDGLPLEAKYPIMHRLVYSHFGCNVACSWNGKGGSLGETR